MKLHIQYEHHRSEKDQPSLLERYYPGGRHRELGWLVSFLAVLSPGVAPGTNLKLGREIEE